jgi:signal transduction histidine kinase
VSQSPALPPRPAASHGDTSLLIADVAALTGVPPPRLRSWEQAGLIHPRRSLNAIRLYGIEDVARVRLVKRSLVNPGRRGSLRRLAKELALGTLRPSAGDYADLTPEPRDPALMPEAEYWRAVVHAMDDLIVVCDNAGGLTYANASLRALLWPPAPSEHTPDQAQAGPPKQPTGGPGQAGAVPSPDILPASLEALPLRWSALTGTRHHDVELVLRGPTGAEVRTWWTIAPLRDEAGALRGAVGVGRKGALETAIQPGELLAIAAHDLGDPVTITMGRIELARRAAEAVRAADHLLRRKEALDLLDQHLAVANLSMIDLMHLLGTLLDAASVARGVLVQQMNPGGVVLNACVLQAVEHARAHTRRHVITVEAPAVPLLVTGDAVRLRQVLDNLFGNAVKYSPDGGSIVARLDYAASLPLLLPDHAPPLPGTHVHVPGWAVIRVSDTGIGIPADAIPHVFDRFWRAQGIARRIRGTGLGLYTSRAIVEAHGGHIWVEHSVPMTENGMPGAAEHGTVMALVLPLAALPEPPNTLN